MKSFTSIITLGLVATCVSAVPVVERDPVVDVYELTVSSDDPVLDGTFLSLVGSTVGIFPNLTPLKIYITTDPTEPGRNTLHTYPIGFADHALALVGDEGLLSFEDVVNIKGLNADVDTTFAFDGASVRNDGPGSWLAFPGDYAGSYNIEWYDGTSFITENYIPVDVQYSSCTGKKL